MGLFDKVSIMLGNGVNVAESKTQELRLKAELSRINQSLEAAYAELGRMVYAGEGQEASLRARYALQFDAVANLSAQEGVLRQQIEELQRAEAMRSMQGANIQRYACPVCGSPVTLAMPNCPSCGDNLASLKSNFRMCPACNRYYSADSMFCENCGSRTIEIPVEQPTSHVAVTQDEHAAQNDVAAGGFVSLGDDGKVCPNCGSPILPGTAFCGNCGARL